MDYLKTHTRLSPIRHGFAPGFINSKKGCTRLTAANDKVYQLLAHGRWFSPGTPASSTTKTSCHNIAVILLKVVLNTKNQSINQSYKLLLFSYTIVDLSDQDIYRLSMKFDVCTEAGSACDYSLIVMDSVELPRSSCQSNWNYGYVKPGEFCFESQVNILLLTIVCSQLNNK